VDDAEALLAAVTDWGQERSDVRAVLVVGSRARTDTPADRWSDTDVVLVVDDPAPYLAGADWLGAFGRPLLSFVEPTAVGPFTERRVLFETGREVDFALLPVAAAMGMAQDPEVMAVLRRGFQVLVDTLGREATLRNSATPPPTTGLPDQAAFAQLTHDFWYHLVWAANPGTDAWHRGRFLERWADPRALRELRHTYAGYDAGNLARALWATAELFQRLEGECAERLGLALSVPHQQLRHQLGELLGPAR
jgi:aminoglycoside 6-adenylyltransferase